MGQKHIHLLVAFNKYSKKKSIQQNCSKKKLIIYEFFFLQKYFCKFTQILKIKN